MNKSVIVLAVASAILAAPSANAHSYYNLTGAGTVASGNSAIGFGPLNSINGTDGVNNNSNSTNRVSDGTNNYNGTTNTYSYISGTGSPAPSATEVPGNLPYSWYSGQHTTAAGVTKRALYTGTSATDNTNNFLTGMGATAASNTLLTLPNGSVLAAPGSTNWGTNTPASLWNAYSLKNATSNYGPIMADLPGGTTDADHPFLAVAGNSAGTGLGVDYGLIHISCGTNTALNNCATTTPVDGLGNPTGPSVNTGDVLTTISIALDSDYPQYSGLLDVALYRGTDVNSTSDRTLASTVGATGPQGSSLGAPIWTASMSSASDLLFYSFIFNQAEWVATGAAGFETNAFYTLMIGAHGGQSTDPVTYNILVTTSPVPVPAAVWLFGSAIAGMGVFGRRKTKSNPA